jgi:uncharacterized membrane protein YqjE
LADALLRLVAQHLASYVELGSAAAAEFRSALARRLAFVVVAALAGTVGLAVLWSAGLLAFWGTPWRMMYIVVSGVILVGAAGWALWHAVATTRSGPSAGILRSELSKDMELFQQWKSTL